jgi:hypothetical protein
MLRQLLQYWGVAIRWCWEAAEARKSCRQVELTITAILHNVAPLLTPAMFAAHVDLVFLRIN